MKVSDSKKTSGKNRRIAGGSGSASGKRAKRAALPRMYPPDLKLRAVKLHLEEGFNLKLVAKELGSAMRA